MEGGGRPFGWSLPMFAKVMKKAFVKHNKTGAVKSMHAARERWWRCGWARWLCRRGRSSGC